MDWGRAKNVLIYAFLLLNMVLGYQLWIDYREQIGSSLDFTSLSESTQRVMEENRIQVLSPIPPETPQLPKIAYTYSVGAQGKPVKLNQPVDTKLIYSDQKELQTALAGQIPNLNQFRHDPLSDKENAFVFRPLVNGEWPLFNVELELFYESQKIEYYRKPVLEIQSTSEVEEQKVLSASKALGTIIERNFIPPKSVVKDIQLGYYGQMFNTDVELAAPAWRFTLDNGEMIYVQGISGDVFTPKTDKIKE
ncbi:two-component system regulatory protein YycI [Paenibacillus sp. N3/727]|uniref:two-component system regulatory protein YycI n=1 Tax=Paenibacillus sp. N3/727 TaxID=2925845 RepID=UPI001F52B967|nr:two-component system regulatory protein YycI [Paenibacillus sp. N3/727]UNK18445.1 two-component system regulatory protein YycI [Paenibacillus sp. N3/727]